MKRKFSFFFSGVLCCLFLIFVLILKTVDVEAIGPQGTQIGLSHLNAAVFQAIGTNMTWYHITQAIGYLAILVALGFAALGLLQVWQRKSLKRVDLNILELGGLYILLFLLYAAFEVVVINYRPIIMPGETQVEASFPSSHTMLAVVIFGSAGMQIKKYINSAFLRKVLKALCYLLIVVMVVGRLLSGVHWLTDIFAGILLSLTLLCIYSDVTEKTHALK